jgi:hypothetical protein
VKTLRRFSKPATASISQPRSNGHAPDEVRMSGCSSKRPFPPPLPDDWDRMSSPRRWKAVRTSVSIRTTDCFRIRTRVGNTGRASQTCTERQ